MADDRGGFKATDYPMGTVGAMHHGDFEPDLLEGTPVVILRPCPDPNYDFDVAFIDATTGVAKITALNEWDIELP